MCPRGLEPRSWWYIPESGIHHHSKVTRADPSAGNSQLDPADASRVKRYAERQATQWEHAAEIRQVYGYRDFSDQGGQRELRPFVDARAWIRPEGPAALFDQAVAWLREQRVLLPGSACWPRLVAEIRGAAGDRLHEMMAAATVTPARAVG